MAWWAIAANGKISKAHHTHQCSACLVSSIAGSVAVPRTSMSRRLIDLRSFTVSTLVRSSLIKLKLNEVCRLHSHAERGQDAITHAWRSLRLLFARTARNDGTLRHDER